MWVDNELAGDIWNGRWSKHNLTTILGEQGKTFVSRKAYVRHVSGTRKLASITKLMETISLKSRGSTTSTSCDVMLTYAIKNEGYGIVLDRI